MTKQERFLTTGIVAFVVVVIIIIILANSPSDHAVSMEARQILVNFREDYQQNYASFTQYHEEHTPQHPEKPVELPEIDYIPTYSPSEPTDSSSPADVGIGSDVACPPGNWSGNDGGDGGDGGDVYY